MQDFWRHLLSDVFYLSRETQINLLLQIAPEKLGRFKTQFWNFGFFKRAIFSNSAHSQVRPISRDLHAELPNV